MLDLTRDGWIFDGYPRSLEQYEQSFLPLLRYINDASGGCLIRVKIVYLEFPADGLLDLYKRIATRYECCVCGTPFSYKGGCKEQCGCADLSTFAFRMDDDYGMLCKRIQGFNETFAGLARALKVDFQEDYHVVSADQGVMAVSGEELVAGELLLDEAVIRLVLIVSLDDVVAVAPGGGAEIIGGAVS